MMEKRTYSKPAMRIVAGKAEPLLAASGEQMNIQKADRSAEYGSATESIWD